MMMSNLPVLEKLEEAVRVVVSDVEQLNMERGTTEKQLALQAIRKAKRLLNEVESQVKLLQVSGE